MDKDTQTNPTITVAGVTFRADQVKTAIVNIDGRDIQIGEKKDSSGIGFKTK